MEQYISKSALVAEINKLTRKNELYLDENVSDSVRSQKTGAYSVLCDLRHFLGTLEVKEVDLEKEIKEEYIKHRRYGVKDNMLVILNESQFNNIAKHFFKIGMCVDNPITVANRGMAEEIIINLKCVEQDYRIDLTKEIEWVRNQVKK